MLKYFEPTAPVWSTCSDPAENPKIALYRENTLTRGRGEICTLKEKSVNLHFICKSTESVLYRCFTLLCNTKVL